MTVQELELAVEECLHEISVALVNSAHPVDERGKLAVRLRSARKSLKGAIAELKAIQKELEE